MRVSKKLLTVEPRSGAGDPHWDQVVLSMHGDVGPPFLDAKGHTVTTNGSTALSVLTKQFGAGSIYFDGTGDYLTLDGSNDFAFGTGDFTIEMWLRPTSFPSQIQVFYDGRPLSTQGAYPTIATFVALQVTTLRYHVNEAWAILGTTPLSTDTWYHIAVCRSNGVTRMFLNGVQEGANFADGTNYLNGANRPALGSNSFDFADIYSYLGFIEDLRITKGVARYTADFSNSLDLGKRTVSLLHFDGNSIDSANGATWTAVAGATVNAEPSVFGTFAGTTVGTAAGSGASFTATKPEFAISATEPFTVEGRVKLVSNQSGVYGSPLSMGDTGGGYLALYQSSAPDPNGLSLQFLMNGGGLTLVTENAGIDWNHYAIVGRENSGVDVYFNGTRVITNYPRGGVVTSQISLGCLQWASGNSIPMSFDEFRFSKTERYSGASFEVPTAAFPNPDFPHTTFLKANPDSGQPVDPYWDNVVLGLHMDGLNNGTVFHDEKGHVIAISGGVVTYQPTKKFGSSSAYFSSSADAIAANSSPSDFEFGVGDFTIEGWFDVTGTGTTTIYDSRPGGTVGPYLLIYQNIGQLIYQSDQVNLITTALPPDWFYLAISRVSGVTRMFIDGVLVGSAADTANLLNPANRPVIGNDGYFPYGTGMNGYIDDLLITKGVGRYIANFTPPTRAFPRS